MTNFIYNMQDELFHLPLEDFSTIKKLVDHIEAQGKQLRELNMTIEKKNKTIEKYEREKKDLQERNSCLYKKVVELNNGIRNSEDLTWKRKYDALLHSSEQAIGALQKKCQEYKNSESDAITSTIETLTKTNKKLEESNKRFMRQCDALRNENNELKEEVNLYVGLCNTKHEEVEALAKAVRCPWGNNAEIISVKTARIKELEEKNKKLERANLDLGDTIGWYVEEFKKLKEDLEKEKQVSKDLNTIINSKNKLLDEYMTKYNNLEHNYKEEVRMKENLKGHVADYIRLNAVLRGKLTSIGEFANKIDDVILSEE